MKNLDGRRSSILLRGEAGGLDLIGGSRGVAIERLHRFARTFRQILADEIELAQELVRHRDDVAAALLGMEDVQELASAGPKQFRLGARGGNLHARICGIGSTPVSAMRPAKTETIAAVAGWSASATVRT